jgi:hypothetical protein
MIQTVQLSDFRTAFAQCGRQSQFSYEALGLLFEYLEEIDSSYNLDVVELCCEYAESTPEEIANSYSIDVDGLADDQMLRTVLAYLYNTTSVVGVTHNNTIVYWSYF